MRLLKYFSIIAFIFAIAFYIRQGEPVYQMLQGKIFGTTYTVKIRVSQKDDTLHDKIKAELASINAQMSVFEPDSEISKINQAPKNKKIILSDNMGYLLRHAQKVYQQSGGAFDPTVGPLIDNWGFGPHKHHQKPTAAQIKQTLCFVGFNKLKFTQNYQVLQKSDGRIALNLSAIAKGYGVDKIADLLEDEGYHDYIIEIGGEVRTSGTRDNVGTAWTVGLSEPRAEGETAIALDITDYAIATSGDYNNYRTNDNGQRYSHTISPHDGYPVKNNLASVTVFEKKCIDADAYATAMMSMGLEEAIIFADKYQITAILFSHTQNNGFNKHYSKKAQEMMR